MSPTRLLVLLLITCAVKQLLTMILVPIWHTPDEQAHFAQVAYYSEFKSIPIAGNDLNREIWESEKLLGTDRDERGNNKFTYHPEYRIEYTNSLEGKYEQEIKNIPISYRKELVKQEAANYPPLYYQISSLIYNTFHSQDLITRIYLNRFLSLILNLGSVFLAFLIGKQVFENDLRKRFLLTIFLGFHPMFSFVSAGVNSDNMFNFLFAGLLYLSLRIIKEGFRLKDLLLTSGLIALLYLTKPQFLIGIVILTFAIYYRLLLMSKVKIELKVVSVGAMITIFAVTIYMFNLKFIDDIASHIGYLSSFAPGADPVIKMTFFEFLKTTLQRTVSETIPWYWGVFDWLGVVFPIEIIRILNRLMIVAAIGVLVYVYRVIARKEVLNHAYVFMFIASGIYFLGITLYNYLFTLSHGFSFGIQGRYFFPTIIPHMVVLIVGLNALIPSKWQKVNFLWHLTQIVFIVALNSIMLWIIATTYYDTSSFTTFLLQASQYKPDLFKGHAITLILVLYITLILVTLKYYVLRIYRGRD